MNSRPAWSTDLVSGLQGDPVSREERGGVGGGGELGLRCLVKEGKQPQLGQTLE